MDRCPTANQNKSETSSGCIQHDEDPLKTTKIQVEDYLITNRKKYVNFDEARKLGDIIRNVVSHDDVLNTSKEDSSLYDFEERKRTRSSSKRPLEKVAGVTLEHDESLTDQRTLRKMRRERAELSEDVQTQRQPGLSQKPIELKPDVLKRANVTPDERASSPRRTRGSKKRISALEAPEKWENRLERRR